MKTFACIHWIEHIFSEFWVNSKMQKLTPHLGPLAGGFFKCLLIAGIFASVSYGIMSGGGETLFIISPFIPFIGLLFTLPTVAVLGYLLLLLAKGRLAEGAGALLAIVCAAAVSQSLHFAQATQAKSAAERIGPSALVNKSEVLEIGNDVCGDSCMVTLAFNGFQVSSLLKNPYQQSEVPEEATSYSKIPIGECFKPKDGTAYHGFMSLGYFDFCIAQKQTRVSPQATRVWSVNNPQHPSDRNSYSVTIEATQLRAGRVEQIARWTKAYIAPVTYFPFSLAPTEPGKIEGSFQNHEFIKELTGIDTTSNITRSANFHPLFQTKAGLNLMMSENEILRREGSSIIASARAEGDQAAEKFFEEELQKMWASGSKYGQAAAAQLCFELSPSVIQKMAPLLVNHVLISRDHSDPLWAYASWCASRAAKGLGYEGAPQDGELALKIFASNTQFKLVDRSVLQVAYFAAASNPKIGPIGAMDALLDYRDRVVIEVNIFDVFGDFCPKLCPVLTPTQSMRLIDQETKPDRAPDFHYMENVWRYSDRAAFRKQFVEKFTFLAAKISNDEQRKNWLEHVGKLVDRKDW
jgi:hypothetical protein